MSQNEKASRRAFLSSSAVASAGAAALVSTQQMAGVHAAGASSSKANRLPREVWIATISQLGLSAVDSSGMSRQVIERMEEIIPMEPDVICLPEAFPFAYIESRTKVSEVADTGIGETLKPFSEFARQHNCYVVCPVYTRHNQNCFNAAVFIDRKGEIAGEYQKSYTTTGEMDGGVCPGPTNPKTFETDFGIVGAQICFDIEWDAGWRELRNQGAEIVFWPSAFGGGVMVNTRAWQNRYCVVSSTQKGTSKICDIDGEQIAATSRWHRWVCAPVNLEKVFLHTWPYVRRFGDIVNKYGSSVRMRTHDEEEWTIIESRDPQVKIADLMKEFELNAIDQHLGIAEQQQERLRPNL